MKPRKIALAVLLAGIGAAPLAHAASDAERIAQLEKMMQAMQQEIDSLKKSNAKEVADLRNQMEASVKENVVVGDIPGSFRIPGTDTSIRMYGVAELNYVKEFKGDNSASDYSTALPYVPLNGSAGNGRRTGESYFHARTSRIGIEGAMPSPYGQLGVKVEGDFNNNRGGSNGSGLGEPGAASGFTNGYQFRLRHAYLTVGPWLFGQTWGTFMDIDNTPETVDFNGPNGNTTIRQPMVRYTYMTPEHGNFIASLENSASYVLKPHVGDGSVYGSGTSSAKSPDIVLRWDKPFTWGALSFAAVSHELRLNDGGNGTVNASRRGTGLRASGKLNTVGDDFFNWIVTGGSGISRYMNGIEGSGYDDANNSILLEKAVGVTLGYQHKFSDTLRSNIVWAGLKSSNGAYHDWANDPARGNLATYVNRKLSQFHINAIWNPVKTVDLGIEYIWGQRTALTGEKGDMSRINFMARYNIN